MDTLSAWIPLIVSLIGSVGLVIINVITVRTNSKREISLDTSNHQHIERMKTEDQSYQDRTRLFDQKQAAFLELFKQIRIAKDRSHRNFDVSTEFWAAVAQAKLLVGFVTRSEIDRAVVAFSNSHFHNASAAEETLFNVLGSDLENGPR